MPVYPLEIQRNSDRSITISWSDDLQQTISSRQLRDLCPCASCRQPDEPVEEDSSPLRILTAAEARPLEIVAMRPAGNYAYHVEFSDGHNTGIFPFDLLRSAATEKE